MAAAKWKLDKTIPEWQSADFTVSKMQELRNIIKLSNHRAMGKALFLATMGFEDDGIMGGNPELPIGKMEYSRQSRGGQPPGELIKPRHMVLAWLAREGLCPMVLTTNYDLLLEGAFRRAGFRLNLPSEVDTARNVDAMSLDPHVEALPAMRYEECTRVARDVQFFNAGGAHQTALIYKIHGCVQTYRKTTHDVADWESYLDSMVFTYREIQNWRQDGWSRDLLYTLLRTRTIAFSGYSVADPVIHDSFRSVYEDMAERRDTAKLNVRCHEPKRRCHQSESAPAFLMDLANQNNFHGLEVLRAASRSVGESLPRLSSHANRLEFVIENDDVKFPSIDLLQQWIFRCAVRRMQKKLLEMHLWSATQAVWQRPDTAENMAAICTNFSLLVQGEDDAVRSYAKRKSNCLISRTSQIATWVTVFHRMLMREFAIAEGQSDPFREKEWGESSEESLRQDRNWYFPLADRPAWAAWAIVVEIAVRRMHAFIRGFRALETGECRLPEEDATENGEPARRVSPGQWAATSWLISPSESAGSPSNEADYLFPWLLFQTDWNSKAKFGLRVRVKSSEHKASQKPIRGSLVKVTEWELSPSSIPWPATEELSNKTKRSSGSLTRLAVGEARRKKPGDSLPPSAEFLWKIATMSNGDWRQHVEDAYRELQPDESDDRDSDKHIQIPGSGNVMKAIHLYLLDTELGIEP